MSEFKLERFKYNWLGDWQSGYDYNRDDVVRVSSISYVCVKQHTSNSDFNVDLDAVIPGSTPPQADPHWIVMTKTQTFVGRWQTGYQYQEGDIVIFNGSLYTCTNGHFSEFFNEQASNWTLFIGGQEFQKDWSQGTQYGLGGIVRYNGLLYKCINPHLSQTILEDNITDWEIFFDGIEFVGDYIPNKLYRKNDYVNFGGSIFRCTTTHTSTSSFNQNYFEIELPGFAFAGEWDPDTDYGIGDIVLFGGIFYTCRYPNKFITPLDELDSTVFWERLLSSYIYRGEWDIDAEYKPGNLVTRGGELYESLTAIDTNDYLDYLDTQKWKLVLPGQKWANAWQTDIRYNKNEITYYLGQAYKCNTSHVSSFLNFPGDNGHGYFYWDIIVESGNPAGMNYFGDLLTYDLSREIVGDGSSYGPTRVPIGTLDQVLSVSSEANVIWRNLHISEVTVIYVSSTGIDKLGNGLDPYHPFRTVRYACNFIEVNEIAPAKVAVSTGYFEEVLPISIPRYTVVMGDELRSVTIAASTEKSEYQIYRAYLAAIMTHWDNIIDDILANVLLTPTVGNEETQILTENEISDISSIVDQLNNNANDIREYFDFKINELGSLPIVVGSNPAITSDDINYAIEIIKANINFIIAEGIAYLNLNLSIENLDNEWFRPRLENLLTSYIYDLRYTGNYMSLRYARFFTNSIYGSTHEDMFYIRDITGLRNCTIEGLSGTLSPEEGTIREVRPTAGAYVSLDPGWGPNDQKVWINTRSPYVQGVTTIGTGCVGAKIDGNLHNGGNKSFVANDFTQVLSDGIGAWMTNKGRCELVSVFTYYCYAGYLAESGGIIRATNGNNSYGTFGSVALGIDPGETPRSATINNRINQASVYSAFAGEISDDSGEVDRILVFEYEHAGEEYSTVTAKVVGAGNFVNPVFDDFRYDGVFEARRIQPVDSTNIGGIGYTNRRNNAQSGDNQSIQLAASDLYEESDYLGQRIVLTSGTGTGQYGYIASYDDEINGGGTRVATVRRESDDQLGWDHVVPGTLIEPILESNTTYSIEPRVIVSEPNFVIDERVNANTRLWSAVAFGEVQGSYPLVIVEDGTGTVDGVQRLEARFSITKAGIDYNVTLTFAGSGYAVDDELIVLGEDLGGSTPNNNLKIIVTEVSDDSTNSIVDFRTEGEAYSYRWVSVTETNIASYSSNGQTWGAELQLPSIQPWSNIAHGNSTFVAISTTSTVGSVAYTTSGTDWVAGSLPSSARLIDITFGNGVFVIVTFNNTKVFYSTNGEDWNSSDIVSATTNKWRAVKFGYEKFLAISGIDRSIATSSDGITWTVEDNILPAAGYDWHELAFGAGRFIALSKTGTISYTIESSLNNWQTVSLPSPGGVTDWDKIVYGNGLFWILATTTDTNYVLTSPNGLVWTERDLGSSRIWGSAYFGLFNNNAGHWVLLSKNIGGGTGDDRVLNIEAGCKAIIRAGLTSTSIDVFKIIDPGSGYNPENAEITVFDNNNTVDVQVELRIGNRVLAQPTFINRGIGYRTSTTTVTLTGDGYADVIPSNSNFITVDGLERYPGPGAQLRIDGLYEEENPDEIRIITLATVEELGDDGSFQNKFRATFRITPDINNSDNLQHGTAVEIRERYSQCRITGHDYLDIGTGNFIQTNYPTLYNAGQLYETFPENEVYEALGGRVFYASTDQDGNFRGGELFSVEQATGIVTISADFFNLDGLSELSLGGVRLGGSGTVIREFSTDPLFSADSNNIIPTQRAVVTFLETRISTGGSELLTNNLIAGLVSIGTADNIMLHTGNKKIKFVKRIDFEGNNNSGVKGYMAALPYFFRPLDEI